MSPNRPRRRKTHQLRPSKRRELLRQNGGNTPIPEGPSFKEGIFDDRPLETGITIDCIDTKKAEDGYSIETNEEGFLFKFSTSDTLATFDKNNYEPSAITEATFGENYSINQTLNNIGQTRDPNRGPNKIIRAVRERAFFHLNTEVPAVTIYAQLDKEANIMEVWAQKTRFKCEKKFEQTKLRSEINNFKIRLSYTIANKLRINRGETRQMKVDYIFEEIIKFSHELAAILIEREDILKILNEAEGSNNPIVKWTSPYRKQNHLKGFKALYETLETNNDED